MKDKPFIENYHPNGKIKFQAWYKDDNQLSDKEVLQRRQKWLNKLILIINKKGIEL